MVITAKIFQPPVVDQSITRDPLTTGAGFWFSFLGVLAAWLGLRRSAWALTLLALALPFAAYRDIGTTTVTLEKVVLAGLIVGLLLGGATLLPRAPPARNILLAGFLVLCTVLLSIIGAAHDDAVVREALKQVEYLAVFWCAATLMIATRGGEQRLQLGIVLAALAVSLLALSQAIFGGAPSGIWINNHVVPRIAGPLEGPNQLAGFLETALPVLWLSPLLLRAVPSFVRYIVIALSVAALIMTQSRAGMAIAVLAFVILWLMDRPAARESLKPTLIGALLGIAAILAWYVMAAHAAALGLERFFSNAVWQNPGGVGTRGELWPAAIALFHRHPFFGAGAGNFEVLLSTVGLHGVRTHANSLWLQTLAEQGIAGTIALIVLALVVVRETWLGARQSWLSRAAFIATICLLLHQFVDDLFFFPKVASLWWLILGASASQSSASVKPRLRE